MKNWVNLVRIVLTISLIVSCSNLELSPKVSSTPRPKIEETPSLTDSPKIPINPDEAFFPLRKDKTGAILPSYQWMECRKRFVICLKWEKRTEYYADLSWFHANDFGLTKRKRP
jgi:hypothetical protein